MTINLPWFWRWFTMKSLRPERAKVQLRALRRQLPMLHAFLAINVVVVAYSHYYIAPLWLSVYVPAILLGFNLTRLAHWLRTPHDPSVGTNAIRRLRWASVISVTFAIAYTSWALTLNAYGGIIAQAHIAVYVAMTLLGFVCCLIYLPQAAIGIAVLAIIPYVGYYLANGHLMFTAIAVDVLLVTLILLRVLLSGFRTFSNLASAKEEAERLHGEVTLLAHSDMVTGLPNRRLFFREIEEKIASCALKQQELSLGIMDLDRFKTANDTFGHLMGDEILEVVGARLRRLFGHEHLVARVGGDEFAFAMAANGAEAARLAEEACRFLSEPYKLGENIVHIGASCGIATTAGVTASVRTLYDSADYALYQSKTHRPGCVTLYSIDHEREVNAERAIEMALQAADFHLEMDLHLQPIVDTATGKIVAVESLARWTSSQIGSVRPDVFIPIAERAGLTYSMTLALFGKALTYLRLLPRNVQLSFNLSALDMTSETTVLAVIAAVHKADIDPARLQLELTETAAIRDFAAAEHSIRTLRAFGFSIALDDFGTGQSSLSYLHRLPIDKVKLDRSFLLEAGGSSGRDLLGGVVKLCHSLKMCCVAEGVEDAEQLRFLQQIGCDLYQGYHFAKPMPINDLLAFLPQRVADQRRAG